MGPKWVYANRRQTYLTWLLLFCIVTASTDGFAEETKVPPAKLAELESAVLKFMATEHVPGLSVAVIQNGEQVWTEGFGMADLENLVPATSNTLYRIASVAKSITATAAMQLFERGQLDLDAPVQLYCPAFPKKEWRITTRELLGHLGGIRHYRSDSADDPEIANTKHFDNPIDGGLNFFKNDSLVAPPGTQLRYSTHGYILVGCVVEGASGQKYADYVRANVLLPSGMTNTVPDDPRAVISHRTRFYSKDEAGRTVNADFVDSSWKLPAGGWLSSAEDMARFGVAILHNRILRLETRDVMWTPQKDACDSENKYALGWEINKNVNISTIGHEGSQQGAKAIIVLVPDRQAGVIVLINSDAVGAGIYSISDQLLKIVLDISTKK